MAITLSRPLVLLLALLALFISLDGLGDRKLANPDEGRYSEIAREMAASGDFVTPRLNGLKYFEKPPLQYWATAISFRLFGESEFTARLYTALCALGCILLTAYCARRVFDEETALLSGLVLLSAPYFAALSEIVTLDMGLTFWMTVSLCAYLIAERTGNERSRSRWLVTAWVGMAGAVLSKGLVGLVFPAGAIFLYGLLERDFGRWKRLGWWPGVPVFLALVLPWFVLVSQANAEFLRFFFIHEHFERFTSTAHRRVEPWWFFLPILFAGVLPWAVSLLPAIRRAWRRAPQLDAAGRTFAPLRLVVIYTLFILAFFSASGSKLPAYILPFFPVLALLLGAYVRQVESRQLAWMILPVAPIGAYGAWWAWHEPARRAGAEATRLLYQSMSGWVVAASAVIALAALVGFLLLRAERKWAGVLVLSLGTMVGIELIERGYEEISPLQSAASLAESIRREAGPEARVYSVKHYEQALPFYLKKTVTLVEYVDEFELGQQAEPDKSMASIASLPAAWAAPGEAVAIIQPFRLDEMKALGLAFTIIHQDPRRMALKKIPAP